MLIKNQRFKVTKSRHPDAIFIFDNWFTVWTKSTAFDIILAPIVKFRHLSLNKEICSPCLSKKLYTQGKPFNDTWPASISTKLTCPDTCPMTMRFPCAAAQVARYSEGSQRTSCISLATQSPLTIKQDGDSRYDWPTSTEKRLMFIHPLSVMRCDPSAETDSSLIGPFVGTLLIAFLFLKGVLP